MQTSIVCRLAFVAIWICAPMGWEAWGQESPFEEPIKKSETGSNDAASRGDISDRNFREEFHNQFDKRGQNPPETKPENDEKRETISDRIFQIRPSKSTEPIDLAGRTRQWIILDHLSPGLDDMEPDDIVDLLLPSDTAVEELDSDETYVPKFKPVLEHVKIAEIQWPDTRKKVTSNNRRIMGPALCVYLTPNEVRRIQSELSFEDLGRQSITHVVRLKHSRAEKLAERLQTSFKSAGIEADADQNAIVIEWNSSWPIQGLIEIENAIKKLDVPKRQPVANIDTFEPPQPNAVAAKPRSTQSGNLPSGESGKVNLTRAIPDTPAARNLIEQLRSHESAATDLATEIRQHANGQADQNQPSIGVLKRKLQSALETAFDLKLQLEEIQVKELQSRLSQHQQQIGQRKALRAKIIARRASDLVEGNTVKWNPKIEGNEAQAETKPVNASVTTPRSNDRGFVDHKITGIQMSGPKGLVMSMEGQRFNIDSKPFSFGISRAIGDPLDLHFEYKPVLNAAVLAGRLDLYPADKYSLNFLRDNVIPIEITEQNIRAAWSSGLIMVVYLPDTEPGMPAPSSVAIIVASSTEDIADPFQEADRRGTILLVLRLAKNKQELPFSKVFPGELPSGLDSIGPDGRSPISNGNTGLVESDQAKNVKPSQFPTPDEFRIQLEPFLKRLHTATEEVRKLETLYFQDRSNGAELQTAIDEFTKAEDELHERCNVIKPAIEQCLSESRISKAIHDALSKQYGDVIEKLSFGKATEAEAKAISEAIRRAKESLIGKEARLESYLNLLDDEHQNFIIGSPDQPLGTYNEPIWEEASFPAAAAMIGIEAATGLKLQFVRFDDLKLPVKAALRVREPKGEFKKGDLIVVLHNHSFSSLGQVVTLMKIYNRQQMSSTTVLSGGIAGKVRKISFINNLDDNNLQPATIDQAGVYFELRLKGPEQKDVLIDYFNGTCVSPDGLVVVPVWSKLIVDGEPIKAFGNAFRKATARIVAADDERGLTLVKLELLQQQLVPWLKCRTGQPGIGQHLTGLEISFESSNSGLSKMNCAVTVMELDQKYARKRIGNDGFAISAQPAFTARMGSPLTAFDDELQGIVVDREFEESTENSTGKLPKRITAIPAIHIQKLIDEYRKQDSKP